MRITQYIEVTLRVTLRVTILESQAENNSAFTLYTDLKYADLYLKKRFNYTDT